jgi:hypothetical protein
MSRNRVIVDLRTSDDAKKVEESVKTGYCETAIESLLAWTAVEHDLVESYGHLAAGANDGAAKSAYLRLKQESEKDSAALARLLGEFESLDRSRIARIELLNTIAA